MGVHISGPDDMDKKKVEELKETPVRNLVSSTITNGLECNLYEERPGSFFGEIKKLYTGVIVWRSLLMLRKKPVQQRMGERVGWLTQEPGNFEGLTLQLCGREFVVYSSYITRKDKIVLTIVER